MNCKRAEIYAEKYEAGELNEIEKRKLDKHLKECSNCRKKYSSALLLGAVLYASEKTAIQTTMSMAWYLKRAAAVTAAVTFITVGVIAVSDKNESQVINVTDNNGVEFISDKTDIKEVKGEVTIKDDIKGKNRKIKIISKEAEKEIEYNLDSKNLKIETRKER